MPLPLLTSFAYKNCSIFRKSRKINFKTYSFQYQQLHRVKISAENGHILNDFKVVDFWLSNQRKLIKLWEEFLRIKSSARLECRRSNELQMQERTVQNSINAKFSVLPEQAVKNSINAKFSIFTNLPYKWAMNITQQLKSTKHPQKCLSSHQI